MDVILIAEDNPDEALLLRKALERAGITAPTRIVGDGEQVLLYLMGRGNYADRGLNPLPGLIVLDLKMPRKSGLEVLEWLSEHKELAVVPTVVLSSSNLEEDVRKAYGLGANTYFVKPGTFDELVQTLKTLQSYWRRAQRVSPRDERDERR